MIRLLDIQKSLTRMLSKHYRDADVITEEQVEDVTTPTFFVSVRPIRTNNNLNYRIKTINVDITYVNEEDNHEENLAIADELQELLYLDFTVGTRQVLIDNLSFSEPSFLICSFTINVYDIAVEDDTDKPKMEQLNYR